MCYRSQITSNLLPALADLLMPVLAFLLHLTEPSDDNSDSATTSGNGPPSFLREALVVFGSLCKCVLFCTSSPSLFSPSHGFHYFLSILLSLSSAVFLPLLLCHDSLLSAPFFQCSWRIACLLFCWKRPQGPLQLCFSLLWGHTGPTCAGEFTSIFNYDHEPCKL